MVNSSNELLVPILSIGNELESPSLSTAISANEATNEDNSGESNRLYTTFLSAIFLTVNATLGAGILNIPHAFNDSGGIFCSISVQTVFVLLIIGSLLILTYCMDVSNSTSYQDLVLSFCGKKCQHLCSVVVILYSLGACITFIIIIGDQFDRIFLSLFGSNFNKYWYMNRSFTMSLTSFILILPLSFSKQIGFLKNASLLGFCTTFYLLFLVIFQYIRTDTQNISVKTEPKTWTEVFYITPILCFAYQCQLSWIPTYSGMKRNESIKTWITIIISLTICYLSYTLIAIFGLLTFGSEYIENDLMSNYDANSHLVFIGIIILIAKTITVYPLLLFCGRIAVDDYLRIFGRSYYWRIGTHSWEPFRRTFVVLIWVFSTILIAIYVPNITIAIEFLGSFATLFVFIFPGLCFLNAILIKDKNLYLLKDKINIFIASLYIILGVFIFGLTLTQTIEKNVLFK